MLTTKCDDHCTLLLFGRVITHQCKGTYMVTEMSIGTNKMANLRCYHEFFLQFHRDIHMSSSCLCRVNYGKLYISLIGNGYVAKIE
jgi:hypothetical protein